MPRRILALGAVFAMILTMAACGEEDRAQPVSGSSPASSSLSAQPPEASSESLEAVPQADDSLVKEVVCTYGALVDSSYDPPRLVPSSVSLFYIDTSWKSPEELTPGNYFSWFFSTTWDEDYEYKKEAYRNPKGENMGWFYPQDLYEARIQEYFQVSTDHLRSDPLYYDAENGGYSIMGGGGKGLVPALSCTWSQEGDLLTVDVALDYGEGQPGSTHRLTVRLEPDGGWKYLGCEVTPE